MQHSRTSGFSLVELSIVLVILGLLVGGILGGQSLIRAAELRAVTTEFEQWRVALNSFKMKYRALPGDMNNATRFFGNAGNGVCNTVRAETRSQPLGGGTCNGNGNGVVFDSSGAARYERFLFWHHLQHAGLIAGNYSGVRGSGVNHHIPGQNAPASKLGSAVWVSAWVGGGSGYFNLNYDKALAITRSASASADSLSAPAFTPEEAWGVDSKFDDGLPAQGIVTAALANNACTDATGASDFSASYNLSESGTLCSLVFHRAY